MQEIHRYVCHSNRVLRIALRLGWSVGARYTNLRDVRDYDQIGFLDIDWTSYNFKRHLDAAKATRPKLTVAQDVVRVNDLSKIIDQAHELARFAERVIIVPKDRK